MGGAALAGWTNAGAPNRMARLKAAIRVFMISLHAESHLHGRRVNRTNGASRVKCAKSPLICASEDTRDAAVQAAPRSVLVSRHLDRGDEAIAAPRDIDNETIPMENATNEASRYKLRLRRSEERRVGKECR